MSRPPMSRLGLLLAVATALCGCSLIADTSDYEFCKPGTLLCSCKPDDTCDPGLDCRPPGRCVAPNSGAAGAGG